tara:strand:+ start:1599 stop:1769 length:171 start_codon:yes stop_codon:yes gene_type:complete
MIEYPLYIDVLGGVAGFLNSVAFIPQEWKVYYPKSTKEILLSMFFVFTFGVLLWFV